MPIVTFSEADLELLRRIVAREKSRPAAAGLGRGRDTYDDDIQTPDVYVARAPANGIGAIETNTAGTGTGSGTGTGTIGGGDGLIDDVPGYGECEVYRIIQSRDGGTPILRPVHGLTRTVYNLSSSEIEGYSWITAIRDKFGKWYAVPAAAGGGGGRDKWISLPWIREYGVSAPAVSIGTTINININACFSTDLTIVAIYADNSGPVTTPSGWTQVGQQLLLGATTKYLWVGYKVGPFSAYSQAFTLGSSGTYTYLRVRVADCQSVGQLGIGQGTADPIPVASFFNGSVLGMTGYVTFVATNGGSVDITPSIVGMINLRGSLGSPNTVITAYSSPGGIHYGVVPEFSLPTTGTTSWAYIQTSLIPYYDYTYSGTIETY